MFQYGGRLVKVDDPHTNNFIVKSLNGLPWTNRGVWIGLHDRDHEHHWEWIRERGSKNFLLLHISSKCILSSTPFWCVFLSCIVNGKKYSVSRALFFNWKIITSLVCALLDESFILCHECTLCTMVPCLSVGPFLAWKWG